MRPAIVTLALALALSGCAAIEATWYYLRCDCIGQRESAPPHSSAGHAPANSTARACGAGECA